MSIPDERIATLEWRAKLIKMQRVARAWKALARKLWAEQRDLRTITEQVNRHFAPQYEARIRADERRRVCGRLKKHLYDQRNAIRPQDMTGRAQAEGVRSGLAAAIRMVAEIEREGSDE